MSQHYIDGPLRKMLEEEGVDLEEFSHKYYGRTTPHTFIDGKIPIDAGYKTPDVEITAFCMLSFLDSTGDHAQSRSIKTYNEIVEKQFLLHRIPERMDVVDKLSRICGTPTPPWLRSMMIK